MLNDIREKIDVIDDQITKLYEERMALAKEVGLEKLRSGVGTENSAREKEIISKEAGKVDDGLKLYVKQLYTTLFETSKAYQRELLDTPAMVKNKIRSALKEESRPFPTSAVVACQGVAGAYSEIAAEKLFPISDISYFKTFDAVFSAVEKGFCKYGVLPIENSSVGSVNAVYDLMRKHNFYIVRSIKIQIKHQLLAPAGVTKSDIKEIFTHEQGFAQCEQYLKDNFPKAKLSVCENTAVASRLVASSERRDIACIASAESAKLYGLSKLDTNVQDSNNNHTRFIAISKQLEIFDNSDKISIMVSLNHEAGSLNRLLNKFSAQNLNLTKLESRPMPDANFEFMFYFDFEADVKSLAVQNLLAELETSGEEFVFLGSYKEVL